MKIKIPRVRYRSKFISRKDALRIAAAHYDADEKELTLLINPYSRGCGYMDSVPDEPCWGVIGPWNDGELLLRSSRLIFIGKRSGKILYDGCAGDEG